MQNTIILILVIVIVLIGWIAYLFRDDLKGMFGNSSASVKEDISHGAKELKEDISHGIKKVVIDAKK
jgi:cbb3-type cytochrome oxidase subunit 3